MKGATNLYFDIYWHYKSRLLSKEFSPGDRLPTMEAVHAQHGVSHGTIRKAMALLEKEGLIVSKPAVGTFFKQEIDIPIWTFTHSTEELTKTLREMRIEPISEIWIDSPTQI